jgi:hypothetical protein
MSSSTSFRESRSRTDRRRDAALVAALLSGPILWLLALEADYVLGARACALAPVVAGAITVVAALISVAAAAWAWRAHGARVHDPGGEPSRIRWMSYAALGLGAWFAVAILAMELPLFALRACGS